MAAIISIFLLCTGWHASCFSGAKSDIVLQESFITPELADFDFHSSCLIETGQGTLFAAFKGGPGKGKSNIDLKQNVGIWGAHFQNGSWTSPKLIVESPSTVCWTPVLVKKPSGELFLFYRAGSTPWSVVALCKRSCDGGLSWSESEALPAGILGPVKSKPVFDDEGNMICGTSVEAGDPKEPFKATACWVDILSREGQWSKHGPIEIPGKRFGCIEPVLFWGKEDSLKMVCRDRSFKLGAEGWIWTAESKDKGKTWTALTKTDLPNPDSSLDAFDAGSGNILLVYNNSHTCRYPLTLALSSDYGQTWTPVLNLEESSGEVPSIILDSLGNVHVSYALAQSLEGQRRIKHIILDLNQLLAGNE